MNVADIMTRDVITVAPETSIRAAAQRLIDHGVSGLPVIDSEGRLVGLVTEGDLIVRQKPHAWPKWWHLLFMDAEQAARDFQKAMGLTVAEVMTRSLICVRPETPLDAAAALLDEHRIRQLPVVDEGALVGIVSRADLIKALAAAPAPNERPLTDTQLVGAMKQRLAQEAWAARHHILLEARDGTLTLWGLVESEAEKSALETMARTIPGCQEVKNRLLVRREVLARSPML